MPAGVAWWSGLTQAQIAAVYQRVFEVGEGAQVLEHLTALYHDRPTYRPGGLEAQRETERRAAQKEVVEYLLRQLGQALSEGDDVAGVET